MPLWGQERGRQSVRLEVGRSQEGPRWVWGYRVDGDREQVVILRVQVGHKEEEFLDGQGQSGAWVGTG